LRAATDAIDRTRTSWLGIAHALDQVTTSNQDQPSPLAVAAGDLALWTGRLAYANPAWTLASGPAAAARPEEERSRKPSEMTEVLAAAHDACDAMGRSLPPTGGRSALSRLPGRSSRLPVPSRAAWTCSAL
jgi:hypothetical protein